MVRLSCTMKSFRKSEHFSANSDQAYFQRLFVHLDAEAARFAQEVFGAGVFGVDGQEDLAQHVRVAACLLEYFEDFSAKDLLVTFSFLVRGRFLLV